MEYFFFFFQAVASGLLADLAPICITDSVANNYAVIPESCSGSNAYRSDGPIHPSAERDFFVFCFCFFTKLYIWQAIKKNFIIGL